MAQWAHAANPSDGGMGVCRDASIADMFSHPTSSAVLRLLTEICCMSVRQAKGHQTIEAVMEVRPLSAVIAFAHRAAEVCVTER